MGSPAALVAEYCIRGSRVLQRRRYQLLGRPPRSGWSAGGL